MGGARARHEEARERGGSDSLPRRAGRSRMRLLAGSWGAVRSGRFAPQWAEPVSFLASVLLWNQPVGKAVPVRLSSSLRPASGAARRWATRTRAPWSSWWTSTASTTSSRSTPVCRWSTPSPRRSPSEHALARGVLPALRGNLSVAPGEVGSLSEHVVESS